jgi:hypothetical protein
MPRFMLTPDMPKRFIVRLTMLAWLFAAQFRCRYFMRGTRSADARTPHYSRCLPRRAAAAAKKHASQAREAVRAGQPIDAPLSRRRTSAPFSIFDFLHTLADAAAIVLIFCRSSRYFDADFIAGCQIFSLRLVRHAAADDIISLRRFHHYFSLAMSFLRDTAAAVRFSIFFTPLSIRQIDVAFPRRWLS